MKVQGRSHVVFCAMNRIYVIDKSSPNRVLSSMNVVTVNSRQSLYLPGAPSSACRLSRVSQALAETPRCRIWGKHS